MEENMRRLDALAHADTERFLARAVNGVCCTYFKGDSEAQLEAVYLIDPDASGIAILTGDELDTREVVCPLASVSEVYQVTKDDEAHFPRAILDSFSAQEASRLVMIVFECELGGKLVKANVCLLEDSREACDHFLLHVPALARRSRSQKPLRLTVDGTSAEGQFQPAPHVQDANSRFRVICRVRPLLLSEGCAATNGPTGKAPTLMNAAMNALGVSRLDKHTLAIMNRQGQEKTFKLGAVFGPDCIQAEVWSEIQGIVQSAADGYNIAVLAAGPVGGGRTFTMLGSSSEGLGVIPRVIEALFALRDPDGWRANLEVDVQFYEIYNANQVIDLLRGHYALSPKSMGTAKSIKSPAGRPHSSSTSPMDSVTGAGSIGHMPSSSLGLAAARNLGDKSVSPKREAGSLPRSAETTWRAEAVAMRRVGSKQELRQLVDEGWRDGHSGRARHVVLSLHLTRTNKSSGVASKSRLTLVDLAGMGRTASAEVIEDYRAIQELLRSKATAQSQQQPPRYQKHALTRALQDCMRGNAKTILLLALQPNIADAEDALAAVSFASSCSW